MSLAQQKLILSSKSLDATQKQALASSVGLTITKSGQVVVTDNLATSLATATTTTSGLSTAFTGLLTTIKPVLTTLATNPLTWLVGLGAGAVFLEDLLTVDYSEANKTLDESIQRYAETKEAVNSLNKEYETNKMRLQELQSLKENGSITQNQQEEFDNLVTQNEQLESQITLQKDLLELQKQVNINNAKEAAAKTSHSIAQSVQAGDSSGQKTFKGLVGKVTDAEAIKEDLALIDNYEGKLPELQEKLIQAKQKVAKYDLLGESGIFKKMVAEASVRNIENEIQHYSEYK